jgi:hypothetical protein
MMQHEFIIYLFSYENIYSRSPSKNTSSYITLLFHASSYIYVADRIHHANALER